MSKGPRKKRRQYSLRTARVSLFTLWVLAFLVYVFSFFATSALKKGVGFPEAQKAAWNVAYVLVPILTSFGSFWFSPTSGSSGRDKKVDGTTVYAIFALTALFHTIVMGYFAFAIFAVDFWDPETPISYSDRVDQGVKWLMLLSAFAVLPVGFVLGGKEPSKLTSKGSLGK